MKKKFIPFVLLLGSFVACMHEDKQDIDYIALAYGDSWPEQFFYPENQLSEDRILLGRHLFYDTRLSRDSSLSCSSCHLQSQAFSDTIPISLGVDDAKGFRNAPSLMNLAFVDRAHKDGGVKSIDLQAMAPIEDHAEMDLALVLAVKRFANDERLNTLAQKAYQRDIDNYSLIFGLAAFVKSLVSNQTKYDSVQANKQVFTPIESKGLAVFEQQCSSCHTPPLFASNAIVNNGTKTDYHADLGRMRISGDSTDIGKFRVPSLRNVELTYPYMHDGHLYSLEEVLEHYNSGGKKHVNQDPRIEKIRLSQDDKTALISFLKTLTDYTIIDNSDFSQPSD